MLNVAIIAGGYSGEYEISVKSGRQVEKNLDPQRFIPTYIGIDRDGWWYLVNGNKLPVNRDDFSIMIDRKKIRFDVVFNAIHGTPGEDGKIQGYFDMLGIPYTSSGVTTSALTFNKSFCKSVIAAYGILTARSVHIYRNQSGDAGNIIDKLTLPLFIKPNNGGSSVGMSKVNRKEELIQAMEKAFHEDDEIMVEEFIAGRELTCGVMRTEGKVIAFPVTEIISKKEFFDYEAKYDASLANEVVPARVPEAASGKCRSVSTFLYERLNCKGVVRFDFIFTGEELYFLEVNTVPGLTEASIVPKMATAYGWSVMELFTRLIEECIK